MTSDDDTTVSTSDLIIAARDEIRSLQSQLTAANERIAQLSAGLEHHDAEVERRVVDRFESAISQTLKRVSTVEYNSHEICKHFAGQVIAALKTAPPTTTKE